MSEACDYKLAQNIGASCDNPQVQGLKNKGYLMNYDDIDFDSLVRDETNSNIVKTLTLKSKAKAYSAYVPGKTPFTGTKSEMQTGTFRNTFNKTASIVVLDSGPDVAKNIIDNLANGKFVFIMENKYQGDEKKNTFEIYGLEQGMTASEITNEKYSEDTNGGWAVTLVEEQAPTSGIFMFNTDITTTRTALDSLLTGNV
nr:MAG TPA: hypothetical protein [Caudoviricetes sp.]